jgi:DNA-binding transcriptional ArsR family regulator
MMPSTTESINYDEKAQFNKIFAHPTRLAILDILRNGEQCVCHLEAHLGLRQAYISQQLMVLKESGIIEETRLGRNIFYKLTNMKALKVLDATELKVNKKSIEKPIMPIQCPCPKCNSKE